MPFCTIVEFEWGDELERDRYEAATRDAGADDTVPSGRLARIVGVDDAGARVIEVWRSGADARAFAEQSAHAVAHMPTPSRVIGFEVTSYAVS
jgi:heme-degrading monooxygenase HmoA